MKYHLPEIYFSKKEPVRDSQNKIVLKHLQTKGSLTRVMATKIYSIYQLSSRIYDLKQQGYDIKKTLVTIGKSHYAVYSL